MVAVSAHAKRKHTIFNEIFKFRYIYLMLLPGLAVYVIFCYFPMYGLLLAFKTFNARLGIWGSHFTGLLNFSFVFRDPAFFNALKNTLVISFSRILLQFPVPIILAILLNELSSNRYRRFLQTVYTFPYFLSWVVIGGIMVNIFGESGAVNGILHSLIGTKLQFLSNSKLFIPLIYITENWKSSGWTSIIYLASIMSISMDQYEAATIDGASKLQKLALITIPGIKSTIVLMLILAVGNIMNAGFDQLFNISNPAVRDATDIIDTFLYRVTFQGPTDFGYSTAVGLFKALINFTLLISCDRIAKAVGERGLYY